MITKIGDFIRVLLVSVLCFIPLTSCDNKSKKEEQSSTTSQETRQTLFVVTSADNPPYEYHEIKSGQDAIVGFDIDLANLIARELNRELVIKDQDFNTLIAEVQAGRADMAMAGFTKTEERNQSVDFSIPYHRGEQALVYKEGTLFQENDQLADNLTGKKIGAQLGSTQQKIAEHLKGDFSVEVVTRNLITQLIQEVKNQRIDAAVVEKAVAAAYIREHPELGLLELKEEEYKDNVAIIFPKGSSLVSEVNDVLKKLQEAGELDKLVNKWFTKMAPDSSEPNSAPLASPTSGSSMPADEEALSPTGDEEKNEEEDIENAGTENLGAENSPAEIESSEAENLEEEKVSSD